MVSKDDLQEYGKLKQYITALDEEIEQTYNTYKSPSLSAQNHSNDPGDPVTRALIRINKLKAKRRDLVSRQVEIEDFVDNIDDSRERTILNYKYMQGLTWRATCQTMQGHESYAMLMEYDRKWWKSQEGQLKNMQ